MSDEHPLMFPLLDGPSVPWELAERAYVTYSRLYGTDQPLSRLAQRGGFSLQELGCHLQGHLATRGHADCVQRIEAATA